MKKIYLLFLLCCFSWAAFAQTTTVTIWANAVAGTYTTGNATSTGTRTDNTIVATGSAPANRGYAVFNLSTIPAGSQITSVTAGFYVSGVSGATITTTTYGYAGDLSTVTTPATLYADMVAGTSLSAVAYTAGIGNKTVLSTAAAVTFLQANIGSKVSYCYTNTGTYSFTITGETGNTTSITTASHAPYLQITYCPPPTVVTATPSPTSLCQGAVLSLTGTYSTTGTPGYTWTGPGGFTSTLLSPTLTTSVTSSGVYTITVTNTCSVGVVATTTATSTFVTVNPTPSAITGGPVCTGGTATLSSIPGGGTWSSSDLTVAAIGTASGILTGNGPGTTTITYTSPAGCVITGTVNDNDPPDPIAGPTSVCIGNSISLTDGAPGGTWSDDGTGTVTTVAGTGAVTGNAAGAASVSYTISGCPAVAYTVTVVALPSAISGPQNVCVGSVITLNDPDPVGTWGSDNLTIASVSGTGVVDGLAPGTVDITFTNPGTTCQAVYSITVNPLPAAISGPSAVCVGSSITLTEPPGGTFSGSGTFGSVAPGGLVTGIMAGLADVTYTIAATTCAISSFVTINPLPAAVNAGTGIVCQGAAIPYSDTDPGGSWSSANTGIATVGVATGIVTGTGAGVTSIIYTLTTGCANAATVTVNASPVATITASGPTTFCAGGSVVLNSSTGPGDLYQWNEGGSPVPGATSTSYSANVTGPYTISITNTLGCQTTSAVENVVAGITGTVINASSLSFCKGGAVVLYANTGTAVGSFNYQWQLNDVSIGGATDSSYAATVSGSYRCQINISGGSGTCAVISDSVSTTVNLPPVPPIAFNGTLLTTAAGYTTYQWFVNNVAIPGATADVLLPTSNGVFKVEVSDGNHCSGFSSQFDLTNVGFNNVNAHADILITPNPATDYLHISSVVPVRVVVTDMQGRILADQASGSDVAVSSLAAGTYLVSVYDDLGNRLKVQKFIKE